MSERRVLLLGCIMGLSERPAGVAAVEYRGINTILLYILDL